jgi:hypothetical protein
MKKLILLVALSIGLTLYSCQNNEVTNLSRSNVSTSFVQLVKISKDSIVPVISGTRAALSNLSEQSQYALSFANIDEYNNFLFSLNKLESAKRITFINSLGLCSMQKLLVNADAELDSIGLKAENESDFRHLYQQYRSKYEKIFVFNKYDTSDLSPYMKDCTDNNLSYLVGENHLIVIDNKITKINFNNRMNENDSILFASHYDMISSKDTRASYNDNTPINGVILKDNGVKHIVSFFSSGANKAVQMHLGAQKKMWYGWKRTSRDFFVKVKLSMGFNYTVDPDNDLGFTLTPHYMYDYYGASNSDHFIGYSVDKYELGTAQLWTELTAQKDEKGKYILIGVPGESKSYPLCRDEKAVNININLVHQ